MQGFLFWSHRADTEKTVDIWFGCGAGRRLEVALARPPGVLSDCPAQHVEFGAVATSYPFSAVAFAHLSRNRSNGKWYMCMSQSDSRPYKKQFNFLT